MPEAAHTRPTIAARQLPRRAPLRFDLVPDGAARDRLAAELGLLALPALRFFGTITPQGAADAALAGRLEATVVQPCVVTLAPVTTRLAETVARLFLADFAEPEGGTETEMEADDTREALPEVIDLMAIAVEALSLALPEYPRAPGAALGETVAGPPGAAPLRDADLRPFAALAALKTRVTPDEP